VPTFPRDSFFLEFGSNVSAREVGENERLVTSAVIEEAVLSDWKTGNFRQLKVFVQNESDGE